MRLLDRYVLRNFFEPFLICFFGFLFILLIFDLYDNFSDFIEYHVKLKSIAAFYLTQIPAMVLWALPTGLVLALLFALSKMSRHNEVISMLTAGVSLWRLFVPLVIMGFLATGFCFALNNAMAPHAESVKKQMLQEITRGAKRAEARQILEGHLFRDRVNRRTWYVRQLRPGNIRSFSVLADDSKEDKRSSNVPRLDDVQIIQQDQEGNILWKWYAKRADHNAKTGQWDLLQATYTEFNPDGSIKGKTPYPAIVTISDWSETPWRIASSALIAQNLSIAELREYLLNNWDFPPISLAPYRTNLADRWAFPWSCLVLVFIAAPLGIVYNRRGVLAAVAGALFLFLGTILLRSFLLALGKGARLDPYVAAWAPNLFFLLIGLVLLWFRSTNRDLSLASLWRVVTFRHG